MRGCSKFIGPADLRALRDANPRTCPVDTEIEEWYWQAVEDSTMLQAGLMTLEDLTLAEYLRAQEVETARAAAAKFWSRDPRNRRG